MSQGTVHFRTGPLFLQDLKVWREVYDEDCYRIGEIPVLSERALIVDIGAHTGSFARKWHEKRPNDSIVCVEACPDNISTLYQNVAGITTMIWDAACSYEEGELVLFNSIFDDGAHFRTGTATGASVVRPKSSLPAPGCTPSEGYGHCTRLSPARIQKVSLTQLIPSPRDRIDLLKLDCEGSEYSILEGMVANEVKVRMIVGEYHGRNRWEEFRRSIFGRNWYYREISQHPNPDRSLGIFHAINLGLDS